MRGRDLAWLTAMALAAAPADTRARPAEPVVAYTITDGSAIEASLTGAPGDAARGRALFASEPRADCAGCHGLPGAGGERSAPDLAGIGGWQPAGTLRLWIVAPAVIAPGTEMPAFYAAGQRKGAEDPLHGGPALTAAEIEDLIAYLMTLKDPG